MACEIIRIGHAIPADIRARRIFRIGPPVISLGKIVVLATGASRTERCRSRYGLFAKIAICGRQDAMPVDGCDVGSLALLLFAQCQSRQEERSGRGARQSVKFST